MDASPGAASAALKPEGPVSLTGAGATFPFPLYSKWISEYTKGRNVKINYQSIGSGGGIRQVVAQTVDFGATDAPMQDSEATDAPGKLLHLPMTIGAVAVAFNVPETPELKLDADTLSGIYLGTVKTWNDPKIAALNSGTTLPALPIAVVYRSDGSGTTAVFSNYLAKVSAAWKEQVGEGKSLKWPVGLGAKGNEGVSGQVKTTPGAVGYIELAYALQNDLSVVALKGPQGDFVKPSVAAVTAAAAGAELTEALTASITNVSADGAYPISAYTYLLVYEDMKDQPKGKALANFLWWAIHDGQSLAAPLHYAPLPASVVAKAEARIKSLKAAGAPAYVP